MGKTKGGRQMNPTDSFRKEQRKKEIVRNKLERKLQRDAYKKRDNHENIKEELSELIDMEKDRGFLSKELKLRKKVLKDAYDGALRRKREEEALKAQGSSLPDNIPLNHPHLTSKAKVRGEIDTGGMPVDLKARLTETPMLQHHDINTGTSIPVPAPPPMPAGPMPGNIPVPAPPPQPSGPPPSSAPGPSNVPPRPPPGIRPPPGPPPGYGPQSSAPRPHAPLPPPTGPPPSFPRPHLPPPAHPPPSAKKETSAIITGTATAVKRPLAQNDASLTRMVPASVRVRRESAVPVAKKSKFTTLGDLGGFGLLGAGVQIPEQKVEQAVAEPKGAEGTQKSSGKKAVPSVHGTSDADLKYKEFIQNMVDLGAM